MYYLGVPTTVTFTEEELSLLHFAVTAAMKPENMQEGFRRSTHLEPKELMESAERVLCEALARAQDERLGPKEDDDED